MIRSERAVISLPAIALCALLLGAPTVWAQSAPDGPLDELLAGEFAAQEGDFAAAARHYLAASRLSEDAELAERAAQVALRSGDPDLAAQALERWHELAPDSDGMLAMSALLALRENRQEAASRALTTLLTEPGRDWHLALRALISSGNAEASAAALGRILQTRGLPDDISAWLAFGGLAQRMFQAEPDAAWVAAVVERFPEHPQAWLLQAGQLRRDGDHDAARLALDRALSLAGDDEAVRQAVAGEFEQLGDTDRALSVLRGGRQSLALLAARAAVLNRLEDNDGLRELYDETRAYQGEPDHPARPLLLGQLAEALERTDQAVDWYRNVPPGPQRSQALLRVAIVLGEAGRLDEAVEQLTQVRGIDPEDHDLIRDSHLLEADLLIRAGHLDRALAAYHAGLAALPDDSELIYGRALLHERLDDIPAAEADLRRILAVEPDNANVLNALGYTLADRTDRHEEALGYIERALVVLPDSAAVIDSMGWVLYRLGRLEESLAYLRRAFELEPDPEIAAHLGEVLWVDGRRDQATEVWRQGLEAAPAHRALRRTLERLAPELLPE